MARDSCDRYDDDRARLVAFSAASKAVETKCNLTRDRIVSLTTGGWNVSAADDEGAVERVLAGDTSAFSTIVLRWQGPLVNLAYRFCRDRQRAEDMAQDVFLQAFRKLSRWRREALFSTWLFALATNLYRSEMRRIRPHFVASSDVPEQADPVTIDADTELSDRALIVRRSLHSLPARYRDALVLFYFHDMDVSQAARSLGVPVGTVKARLSRGRDILRRKLAATLRVLRDDHEAR